MGKKIIINESKLGLLKESEEIKTTQYSFMTASKEFIIDLLGNPNIENNDFFSKRGISKNKLISMMIKMEILYVEKKKVNDDGTISVKYSTGSNLKQKLRKLYIKLFEQNTKINEEDGAGGIGGGESMGGDVMGGSTTTFTSSGAYTSPLFGTPIKKKMPIEITETSLGTVGDISYDAPAFGDDETLNHDNLVAKSIEDDKSN